jgi:predicted Zn-dependent peptidase
MKGLAITGENLKNQQEVVKNEVRVNVLNQPYGGFPWLDMPQYANTNWFNSHNFYGDLKDLDSATLEDVSKFFKTFYSPNNAALVVVGDFDPAQARAWIDKYFAPVPASQLPPKPDISEPRQEKEKRASKDDKLATRPALAIGYHAPRRNTPEYYAMGLIDEIMLQGKDSRLYQALVQKNGLTGDVNGGINELGNMFNINGPVLWDVSLIHDKDKSDDQVLKVFDAEIEKLRTQPVDQATLDRALVKKRSWFYDKMEQFNGFGKADMLASLALFDDDPKKINQIEAELRKVTPALIQKTAQTYLAPENRTILVIVPKGDAKESPAGAPAKSGK